VIVDIADLKNNYQSHKPTYPYSMKRNHFLLTLLALMPVTTFAKINNWIRPKKGIKVGAGEDRFNDTVKLGSSSNYCKISAKDTEGAMAVFENVAHAKGGPPMHIHPNQDEIFAIIEGEYLFQVGEEQFEVKAGDTLFAPRAVPHAFTRVGDKPGKLMITYQPAGKMEEFYKKLKTFGQMPKPEEFARIFEEHEMKIVGPRLPVK
jgi:mannose-6-phosphate isomerase-like protein (cupin superfamily)